jgi:hypothetical protein
MKVSAQPHVPAPLPSKKGYTLGGRLDVLQIRSNLCGGKYLLLLPGIESQFLGRPTLRRVIIHVSVETDENHLKFQSG